MQDFGRPNTVFVTNAIRALTIGQEACTSFPDMPLGDSATIKPFDINCLKGLNVDYQSARDVFMENTSIDLPDAQALEKRTVLQGESTEWLEQHNLRVTASNFGKIYFRKQQPSEKMINNMFTTKDLSKVKAIAHGKSKEKVERTIYAKKMQKQAHHFAVFDAGLAVDPCNPYLGASPDDKVFDPASTNSKYGLPEIKCPFTKRAETLEQAAADPSFYLEKTGNSFYLKRVHSTGYYAQVQGQPAITGLRWCDFCIFLSDSNEMCIDRIPYDHDYWSNKLLPKLSDFFLNHALKFIVTESEKGKSGQ